MAASAPSSGWAGRVATCACSLCRKAHTRNTATFNHDGDLWFTGQSGVIGRLAPSTGKVTVSEALVHGGKADEGQPPVPAAYFELAERRTALGLAAASMRLRTAAPTMASVRLT